MAKFDESLQKVNETIKTMMTKDNVSDDELNVLTELKGQVDELGKQHQELVESHSKMKDKYIEAVTNFGTKEKPDEDDSAEKTFEEIAREVLASSK